MQLIAETEEYICSLIQNIDYYIETEFSLYGFDCRIKIGTMDFDSIRQSILHNDHMLILSGRFYVRLYFGNGSTNYEFGKIKEHLVSFSRFLNIIDSKRSCNLNFSRLLIFSDGWYIYDRTYIKYSFCPICGNRFPDVAQPIYENILNRFQFINQL